MKPTRTCTFDGCERRSRACGLCGGHYQQMRNGQELRALQTRPVWSSLEERFWSKVNKSAPNGCWEWTAPPTSTGYGQFGIKKRMYLAHRVAWELTRGTIPAGKVIDHRCGNRMCVNPEHLRAVTQAQNTQHRVSLRKGNASGVRGVWWDKQRNAWQLQIKLGGHAYFGGRYSTLQEAESASKKLRAKLFTHDDHDEWVKDNNLGEQACRRTK